MNDQTAINVAVDFNNMSKRGLLDGRIYPIKCTAQELISFFGTDNIENLLFDPSPRSADGEKCYFFVYTTQPARLWSLVLTDSLGREHIKTSANEETLNKYHDLIKRKSPCMPGFPDDWTKVTFVQMDFKSIA